MFGFWESILSFLIRMVGLRTEAADAAGSLHAKVKDVRDNGIASVNSKIGTSTDTRASNTVMGWNATRIKSWQRVVFTPTASPYGATIASVDPSKCIVLLNGTGIASFVDNATTYFKDLHYYISGFTATTLSVATSSGAAYLHGTLSAIIVEFY